MAISVRDIQEKEFATQTRGGYNIEEVDDFLDEIAGQLSALVRENVELSKQVSALEAEVEADKQTMADMEKKLPDYNEKGYFDNLQKSMREAIIGAQRIADETRAEAEQEAARIRTEAQALADETLNNAQAESDRITGGMQAKLDALTKQYEALKASAKSYKDDYAALLEAQTAFLRDKTDLI